jgi:hypothetical protein
MRALGLDAGLLAPESPGGETDKKAMRVDLEQLLAKMPDLDEKQIGKILALLDEHAPFDKIDDDDPQAERARALAGDDETHEKLRALLKSAGLNDDDIDAALTLASRALDETMPKNALAGSFGAMDSLLKFRPDLASSRSAPERPRGGSIGQGFIGRHPEAARVF